MHIIPVLRVGSLYLISLGHHLENGEDSLRCIYTMTIIYNDIHEVITSLINQSGEGYYRVEIDE